MKQGFIASDFPSNPPIEDGKCYFAAPSYRSLAEEIIDTTKMEY